MSGPATPISRNGALVIGFSMLAVFALALVSPSIFNDGDTYWHIRAGQWMLTHHAVLTRDPFSLSFGGKSWQTQEWLAEIALAASFQTFGWSGVAILTGGAIAAATGLLAVFLVRRLDAFACAIVLILAIACVMPDFLARPHMLALPFTTVWLIGLSDASRQQRPPRWTLLGAMLIWTNLHGSFLFGLALLVPFGIEAVHGETHARAQLALKWCLFAGLAVAVTLLNPRGLGGLLFPFRLMHLHSLAQIGEWRSPDFGLGNPVQIALFAALFFFIWRGVRLPAIRLLLLLALAWLWLAHARYGMLLGIAGAVLSADSLGSPPQSGADAPTERWRAGLPIAAFGAAFLLFAGLRIGRPETHTDSAQAALAAVPPGLAELPVFNNYSFGGLLIFDRLKPLVDSRADLYGDSYLSRYAHAINGDLPAVNAFFQAYKIAWTMLAPGDPLVAILDRRPGWRRIYSDRTAVIQIGPLANFGKIRSASVNTRMTTAKAVIPDAQ